ncbi:gamma-butyrobetaine hydroxylase-like domain-containing protein [Microbulbifer yueqingensis]|uniref:DUF971 family protein n=1 Tax=Microbulbifer yueqingensis TaxID=658219 RepID=A0A1G9BHZ7_9GAMM|nr:DUF971 domain-containing protein [Microbulbifer yueqingensis]SDK38485.1 DUF971 family protein [Microbulbifer yueqingensis]
MKPAIKPGKIRLDRADKSLQLVYPDRECTLPAEYLRVYSPSAEVRGHGPGQEQLVHGKINVGIESVTTAGRYALQILFDDGHDSGIYTWAYLRELCEKQEEYWQDYLRRLQEAGRGRDPDESPVRIIG